MNCEFGSEMGRFWSLKALYIHKAIHMALGSSLLLRHNTNAAVSNHIVPSWAQFRDDIDNISNIALARLAQRPDSFPGATIRLAMVPEIWIVQLYMVAVRKCANLVFELYKIATQDPTFGCGISSVPPRSAEPYTFRPDGLSDAARKSELNAHGLYNTIFRPITHRTTLLISTVATRCSQCAI